MLLLFQIPPRDSQRMSTAHTSIDKDVQKLLLAWVKSECTRLKLDIYKKLTNKVLTEGASVFKLHLDYVTNKVKNFQRQLRVEQPQGPSQAQ